MKIKILKLSLLIFLSVVFFYPKPTYALSYLWTYFQVTSDDTPDIRGEVDDAAAVVTVTFGAVDTVATNNGDGTWHLQMGAMGYDDYDFDVRAEKAGEDTLTNELTNGLIIVDTGFPYEFYAKGVDGSHLEFLNFSINQDWDISDSLELNLLADTTAIKTGGGTFSLGDWDIAEMTSENNDVLKAIKFGIEGADLTFSKNITIQFNVGNGYNGQTLSIFSKSQLTSDSDWEEAGTCVVSGGICSLTVSHASYYIVSENEDLIEEDGSGNDHDKFKYYKSHFKNKGDKADYFSVRETKRKNQPLFWAMRQTYLKYKFTSNTGISKLDENTRNTFKKFKNYHGYKKYKDYKDKIHGNVDIDLDEVPGGPI